MTAALAALALVNVLLAVVVVSLLRSHADILRALHDAGIRPSEAGDLTGGRSLTDRIPHEGSALSAEALDIVGQSPTGDAISISLGATHRTLLAFLSSGCLTCQELWATIESEGQPMTQRLGARLVVVGKGAAEESPSALAGLATATAPTVLSSDAWAHFGVPVSPYFVLIDGTQQRVIGEGAGASWAQVGRLLEQALADAGVDLDSPPATDRRAFLTGRQREARADRALLDAGIQPGDPRLRPPVPRGSDDRTDR